MPNLHMPTNSGVLGMRVKQPWRQTYVRLLVLTHNAKMKIEDAWISIYNLHLDITEP